MTIQALYSISTSRNPDSTSLSGSITDFSVGDVVSQIKEVKPRLPISFTGKISNHSLKLETVPVTQAQTENICNDISQTPLKIIQRNIIVLPVEITTEQTWRDSTVSQACSGTLLLNVTSVRTFHVVGQTQLEDVRAIVIDQNERTFSKGEGSQGQHRIFIEAQGTGIRHLYVDQITGVVLSSRAASSTSLSIQASGRVQHFLETSTEVIQKIR